MQHLHLYDLNSAPLQKQKKWKWLLAMVSHRFAVRLGHYMKHASRSAKVTELQGSIIILKFMNIDIASDSCYLDCYE